MNNDWVNELMNIEWIDEYWMNWWALNELMDIEQWMNNVWVDEKWMSEWILNELKNIEWINEYWMNLWIEWIMN